MCVGDTESVLDTVTFRQRQWENKIGSLCCALLLQRGKTNSQDGEPIEASGTVCVMYCYIKKSLG